MGKVVPTRAKTPARVKQGNPKAKRSVKSNPIGYKNAKIPMKQVTGGKTGVTLKQRGGMGSVRPNFGKAGRSQAIPGIGGR